MAYDEKLAQRLRTLLAGEVGVTEKRMFGGLAFPIRGNMAVTASHRGGLMIRVDRQTQPSLSRERTRARSEVRGRAMPGWLHVRDSDLRTKRQVTRWVELAATYTRSLPPKG
jgi:TfoX/Sxy family transcriptional regulator of competence genes